MEQSWKELTLNPDDNNIAFVTEEEIGKLGKDGIIAFSSSATEYSSKKVYIFQRWLEKWSVFVDVTDAKQIVDGNRLTIVCLQFSSKAASGFDTPHGEVSITAGVSERHKFSMY